MASKTVATKFGRSIRTNIRTAIESRFSNHPRPELTTNFYSQQNRWLHLPSQPIPGLATLPVAEIVTRPTLVYPQTIYPNTVATAKAAIQFRDETLQQTKEPEKWKERFIPATRHTICRMLVEEPEFLSSNEQIEFERLSTSFEKIVSNSYLSVIEQLKVLFDPLNPDTDTVLTRKIPIRERMDREFELLQKLSIVLEKGNFYELPHHITRQALRQHETKGVTIGIDDSKYAVLRIWALGRENPNVRLPWFIRLVERFGFRKLPGASSTKWRTREFFKRVVTATRMKTDDTLILRAFKDVPRDHLPHLLPSGSTEMTATQRTIYKSASYVTGLSAFATLIAWLAEASSTALLSGGAFVGGGTLVAAALVAAHQDARARFLAEANRTLHFKTMGSNQGLIETLVLRAAGETFKEAILVYSFLLAQRPPSSSERRNSVSSVDQNPAKITVRLLERTIEAWVYRKLGVWVFFDANEAIQLLQTLGIVHRKADWVCAIPLESATKFLPSIKDFVVENGETAHIPHDVERFHNNNLDALEIEGYDKDLHNNDLLNEENRRQRYGWAPT